MSTQQHITNYEILIARLDLSDFIAHFKTYFARKKSFIFNGDRRFYAQVLKELDSIALNPPPKISSLDTPIKLLQKHAILNLENIFCFMQIVRYFLYLKSYISESAPSTQAWLNKITIPQDIYEIESIFDTKGEIKEGIYPHIDTLKTHIKQNKKHIDEQILSILHSSSIHPYLVDSNIHYLNENECLLLKAGYNHAIKGTVLDRSHNGFFYLLPHAIVELKERQNILKDNLMQNLYELCTSLCQTLRKYLPFLTFLNAAFDTFDHIHARLCFAKNYNLSFIYEMLKQKDIIVYEFSHPALHNPKPINIEYIGEILMITGVNAGGKTMLLKALLGACFLAKYLIPMKINAYRSKIPYFKHIAAIISDPQNSKNDISTFAGRMLELKQVLNMPHLLLGIDEIELGTDSDEAASLYKVILEHLLQNQTKVLLTTHHKHLAALMANNPKVQLCAAMYDIQAQKPLFSFLQGNIGKSYAFESAQQYGIPPNLIKKAKDVYGQDKERLNELIERSSELEIMLQRKMKEAESLIADYQSKILSLEKQKEAQEEAFSKLRNNLEMSYYQATQTLKAALKSQNSKEIHKAFNQSHKILKQAQPLQQPMQESHIFKVGDRVKYKNTGGKILSIKAKTCIVELDEGMKLKEKLVNLKPSYNQYQPPKATSTFKYQKSVTPNLDLHGMRGDEAIEKLDEFLSDTLISGYDEVIVYHGIGSGILSRLVYEYLKNHPKVVSFEDAPAQMGGYGAKIIRL